MDIDDLEDKLGIISLYQILCLLPVAWFLFSTAIPAQTGVFYNAVPQHRCSLPNFGNGTTYANFTDENITALAIPPGDSCHRYVYNKTECLTTGLLSCLTNISKEEVTECDDGYHYDKKYFEKTIISEWDLVCNKQIWVAILNSLYFVGVLIGSPLVGYISDRFGRKFTMIVLTCGIVASGIGCSFSPNLAVYCLFRILEGVTSIPSTGVGLTYANEFSGKKSRLYVGCTAIMAVSIAFTVLPVIAQFLRNWRKLNLCIALGPLIFLFICPFIPPTPRWLLVKGRTIQAKKIVDCIAKSKGKTVSDNDWELVVQTEKNKMGVEKSSSRMTDLFKRPFTRVVTLVILFDWVAINCVFYGLVLNVSTLSGDLYFNAILNGATQIVACVPYIFFVVKKGPKTTLVVGTTTSGLFCIIAMIAGEFKDSHAAASEIARWTSIIGKFFASIAYFSTYQYTNDVVPTVTRGQAMGLASASARIGSIIVPFILHTQLEAQWVVQALFGILAISSALLTLLLPGSKTLTTTLQEAENYYRTNMKFVAKYVGKSSDRQEENGKYNDGFKTEVELTEVKRTETVKVEKVL